MRVNVYIDDDVMVRVDSFCKENGLRRGAFLTMAATDFLRSKELAPQLKEILGDFLKMSGQAVQGEISRDEYDRLSRSTEEQIEQLRLNLDK